MISVFANFRINNQERLHLFKLSFNSIKNDPNFDNWVINCRGDYKTHVENILREALGDKLIFSSKESKKGWFYDSSEMLKNLKNHFVFFWIEDHVKISNHFINISELKDLENNDVDYLQYSFTHSARFKSLQPFMVGEDSKFKYYSINKENTKKLEGKIYIVSVVGLFSKFFFEKIITTNHPILKRWPRNTPFDFEKTNHDKLFLPIKIALPKSEIFACIDDDHDIENYSLVSRGLINLKTEIRESLKSKENKEMLSSKYTFLKYTPKFLKQIYRILIRIKYTYF